MRCDFWLNDTKWGVVLISSSSRRRDRNLRGQSRSCCWVKLVGSKHVVFSGGWTNQVMVIRQRHKTLRRRHHQLSLLRIISRRTETAHSIHNVALIFQAFSCLYFTFWWSKKLRRRWNGAAPQTCIQFYCVGRERQWKNRVSRSRTVNRGHDRK